MRRMYSEQELTKVIGDVLDSKIEDGSFDESIADYIDEYLVKHPIDITALNGKDVSCKSVTTTNNVVVGGNLSVTGNITGASIIENMENGYALVTTPSVDEETYSRTISYAGAVKNGNKVTFAFLMSFTRKDTIVGNAINVVFNIPYSIWSKLSYVPIGSINSAVSFGESYFANDINAGVHLPFIVSKDISGTEYRFKISYYKPNDNLTLNTLYKVRFEVTFLLGENLAS